jgi:hypothetical protein
MFYVHHGTHHCALQNIEPLSTVCGTVFAKTLVDFMYDSPANSRSNLEVPLVSPVHSAGMAEAAADDAVEDLSRPEYRLRMLAAKSPSASQPLRM